LSAVTLQIEGDPPLSPVRLRGVERLGEPSTFELDVQGPSDDPVAPASVLRKAARVRFESATGERAVAGVVTRFVIIAGDHRHTRAYRLTLQSGLALLALRRPARTFQELSAPEIVEQVVREGGYSAFEKRLRGSHPKRRYVVQYQETGLAFVKRICEEHGLFFHFSPTEDGEAFVLEDDSTTTEEPYPRGIAVVSRTTESETRPIAHGLVRRTERAVGKVTLRDYTPDKPDLRLESTSELGLPEERALERYEAPGGFQSPEEGAVRAKLRLESLRATASLLTFETNALALSPGAGCTLAETTDHQGSLHAAGAYTVIATRTQWDATKGVLHATIEAIPRAIPFRLARVTPRPRIAGVQSAWVTGASGSEIHPDALGRVNLRFHWDLHGKSDHGSSLPVRVLQPHVSGPMILPRVGWEVFVMFEDGDPDRPYVLGRSYNQKQPPPLPLPANKTVTSIATDSSPGKGARSVIQMDDAAGREHLLFNAPFAKTHTVAGKSTEQILKNENMQVGANQQATISGSETISVDVGYMGGYGSRSVVVGGAQTQTAGGNFVSQVGSELDIVGGVLVEQAGNPVKGALQLAISSAISLVGTQGKKGMAIAAAMGAGRAALEGAKQGGLEGAGKAALGSVAGSAVGLIPGGEAIMASVMGSSRPMPWDHGRPDQGAAAPGGGAVGASGADGGPAGPGPGHRSVVAKSSYSELVGGTYTIGTPGPVSWVTAGGSTTIIKGSHLTQTASAGIKVGGGLVEQLGSLTIKAADLTRSVTGSMSSTIAGALKMSAGGPYSLSAKSVLTLRIGGSLTLTGSPVTFVCGASKIVAEPGSVSITAPSIQINGNTREAGALTHQ
jgi:type VI secretion system secreted protein VgrG